jgi:peptidoglycan hydrolase CwlO-like protein
MKAVSAGTDYYKRLLQELDQQESQIQDLHKQIESLQKQQQNQQKELEDYLVNQNVG